MGSIREGYSLSALRVSSKMSEAAAELASQGHLSISRNESNEDDSFYCSS